MSHGICHESSAEMIRSTLEYAHSRIERALRIGVVQVSGQRASHAPRKPGGTRRSATDKAQRATTPTERAAIGKAWLAGATYVVLKRDFGREYAGVLDILRQEGIDPASRSKRRSCRSRIEEMLRRWQSPSAIAAALHTGLTYVYSVQRELVSAGTLSKPERAKRTKKEAA